MRQPFVNGRRAGAVVALAGLLALPGCQKAQSKPVASRPAEVQVSLPIADEFTDFEDFTGRTQAVRSVDVNARVTGYLEKVQFEDGSEVEKGAPLFEIDPRPYQAELDRAVATLEQSEALQNRLEADYRRRSATFARGAASREELDKVAGDYAEARAAVGVAKANRDRAKLDLEWTKVAAPISGRISRRMVDPGNLVKADQTVLTSIVTLDPMYVYFEVDERTLLRIRRLIREGRVQSRTEAEVPVLAALADEQGFPHRGAIDFSDNKVDPGTGTLSVRGVVKNPTPRVLSPGMFIRVRLPIGKPRQALTVAEQAVGTDQGRRFVYVVDGKNEVIYRPVKVGPLLEGRRVVEEGLKPDDRIIVSGLQRVRPGAKVAPKLVADAQARTHAGGIDALARGDEPSAAKGSKPDAAPAAKGASAPGPTAASIH